MRTALLVTVVLVVVEVLCAGGCENATILSPTGNPVSDASVCSDGNCVAGNVTCGSLTCFGGEQYCTVAVAGCDAGTMEKAYACPLLPVTCGQGAGCSCLGTLAAGCSCVEKDGTPIVTCCVADAGVGSEASSDAPSEGSSD
jgi:hypothetical protein